MKFIICGGGSGGHVSPAIAIYEALKEADSTANFAFVGRRGGQENQAYIKTAKSLYTLDMKGINGKNPIKALGGALSAAKALYSAHKIIKAEKPDAVIGTGGYVTWPVLTVAKKMGIPTIIHEANAYPGLTTRLLSKSADKVLLNYKEAGERLKKKDNIKVVGNPLRKEFYTVNRKIARKKLGIKDNDIFILSFGGSLGAKNLNDTVVEFMKKYSSKNRNIKHIHAVGRSYYDIISDSKLRSTNGCILVPYVENMAETMSAADIVISRCGAMTLSEICAIGVASILIPSPNVSDNHQLKNGRFMEKTGASLLIEDDALCERTLLDAVRTLEHNIEKRKAMAKSAKELSKENASEIIAEEILSLCKK